MPTLAHQLGETAPVSLLIRKSRFLGISGQEAILHLAAARGCHHYATPPPTAFNDPGRACLTDEEVTILLIAGESPYQPLAIRCAAQLARSHLADPIRLATLAIREKCVRVLSHIARCGLAHDPDGIAFWQTVLKHLPFFPPREEPDLPHWSRFVSMPGYQRNRIAHSRWLTPTP